MNQARPQNSGSSFSRPTVVSALAGWVLSGSLVGSLGALADWRRLVLNGDFTARVYLDRIWISAVLFGALCGLAAGLIFLLTRRLLVSRWPAILDRLMVSRLAALALLLPLVLGYGLMRAATPRLEGRRPLEQLDKAAEAARSPNSAGGAVPARRPPVILLLLDTVRADHLSLYGYERGTTPNLEAFANHAVVYESVRSSASWTIPAHATLFTGLYPHQHGVHRYIPEKVDRSNPMQAYPLAPETRTLAGLLDEAGYRTAAFSANPILNSRSRLDRGFQLFHHSRNLNSTIPLLTEPLQKLLFGRDALTAFRQQTMSAHQVNRRAAHWLERRDGRPFFLFINYMDAHSPYDPDPPFDRIYPGAWEGFPEWRSFSAGFRNRPVPLTGKVRAHIVSRYDGAIRSLDHQLGLFFDLLRQRGLYDQSLIIVTSDHGEHFGEHGLIEHSKDVYEEVLRVPLLVKYPGPARSGRDEVPASLVDILPTVLDAAGLPPPDGLAGRLLGSASPGRRLNESYDPQKAGGDGPRPAGSPGRFIRVRRSIHLGQMKFIWSSDQAHELYDLQADPGESTNLLAEKPELAQRFLPLAEEIDANSVLPEPGAEQEALDDDLLRHLEELGYVESAGE